ncbi:MAG TPA: Maf family nucleotide pyrophosphatase [Rhizomicrobium sp.]|jgi:septum formation protein
MPLVLASASAARARMLRAAGVAFEVLAASVDEEAERIACGQRTPLDIASHLALKKALQISSIRPGCLVLGADQVLDLDGQAVGKCATADEARALLSRLRGRDHELVSAAVLVEGERELWRCAERCRLVMRSFSDEFLADYLRSEEPAVLTSVGCYQVEGTGIQLFDRIEGDYFSVLGLPLLPLLAALRSHGIVRR